MSCLAFVNSWFTAPPYIRSRCFARGSEVVFYYIYFFFDFKFNTMSNTMYSSCSGGVYNRTSFRFGWTGLYGT